MTERDALYLTSTGTILRLVRESEDGVTRSDLMEQTGLARATVAARLSDLIEQGLVVEVAGDVSTGGRPPSRMVFNAGAGVVLAIDAGASRTSLAVADLGGKVLAERAEKRPLKEGPQAILAWACEELDDMLAETGRGHADVRAVGAAFPGSFEYGTGRPVSPPLMPGWDGFPVADTLREHFGADVLVDNDVNVMALGEGRQHGPDEQLVVVKAGTAIGLSYITGGVVQRGAQGCAGDIGHTRVVDFEDVQCHCGKRGCLQAIAGGRAMAARLTELGVVCTGAADVATAARNGSPEAIAAVRSAGRALGYVLSGVVNVLNPSRLLIAGDLTEARDFLLSAIRETVYRESGPLATSELEISRATAGIRAGVIGATTMALEHALAPATIASFAGARAA
jgi:predicted NBD/HSP70 family sugar kinase